MLASFRKFRTADFVNLLLELDAVEGFDPEVRENLDAMFELAVDAGKEAALLVVSSFKGCRVGDSPMRGDRLTGPHRTLLGGSLVADREDKIEARAVARGELVPALGP